MLKFLFLSMLLLATIVSPEPTPRVSAPSLSTQAWLASPSVPADPTEIMRFIRHEADDSISQIIADQQNCHCDPANAARMLQNALAQAGASLHLEATTFCGLPAQHLVATNLAHPDNSQYNLEVYLFRREPNLMTITYLFRALHPAADAQPQLHDICTMLH
jgi:hypothetical protein